MPQTIVVFFKVIDNRLRYDSEENTLFLQAQLLKIAYHAVRSSGIYTNACKDWRGKPSADNTWANFKIFFALEYNKLR